MQKDKIKNKKRDERLYNKDFIQACNNAVNGIVYCATTQTNVRKELILGTVVMVLSLFYDFSTAEFLCLTFAVFFVIFAELINTAIETVVDLYVDIYHPKAKIAKDVAAGAVLLASINAVIVGYFLLIKQTNFYEINNSIFSHMIASKSHLEFVSIILTVILIIAVKSAAEMKKMQGKGIQRFIPSGQSAVAFAILTAIWLNTRDVITFCLALLLSILIAGNRMNDTRSLGEVIFGAMMGALVVLMVYGLMFLKTNA